MFIMKHNQTDKFFQLCFIINIARNLSLQDKRDWFSCEIKTIIDRALMTKKTWKTCGQSKTYFNVSTRSCRCEKTLPTVLKIFKGCLQGLFLERWRHNVSSKIFDVKFNIAVYESIGILIVINNFINTYGQKCTSNGSTALKVTTLVTSSLIKNAKKQFTKEMPYRDLQSRWSISFEWKNSLHLQSVLKIIYLYTWTKVS